MSISKVIIVDDLNELHSSSDSDCSDIRGCEHYERGCKMVCPVCDEIYDCRFCHDKVKMDYKLDIKLQHEINRHVVKEIVCSICKKKQQLSNKCITNDCNKKFGEYFCNHCCLFDDDGINKKLYHCDKCGICRIGPEENYYHCDDCNMCRGIECKELHKCTDLTDEVCPICSDLLHNSRNPITSLKCGHWIHIECLDELAKSGTHICPFCSKSFVDLSNYNIQLDSVISNVKMPDEYIKKKVDILCNECLKSNEVSFHFYGHKCPDCGTYNTRLK
jgi:RING finger/CHY zinc finger protein 1